MPRRPQRPCSYPGCPNRCDGQYCEEHAKQMNRRYNKFTRPADSNKNTAEHGVRYESGMLRLTHCAKCV